MQGCQQKRYTSAFLIYWGRQNQTYTKLLFFYSRIHPVQGSGDISQVSWVSMLAPE